MEGYKCKVGKGLLKICMGDNYTDATVVFREYVQNAIDAIYQAEEAGIISNTENYVSINIENGDVEIMDRGIGVKSQDIGPVLVDLGNSQKSNTDIGQYGIGRLSGANWCDKVIFETSYKGEPTRSILTFDSQLARTLVSENNTQECSDVMDKVTTLQEEKEEADDHYFRVKLINVKDELRNEETIRNYLSFIAPVPYEENFYDDCQKKAFITFPEFKEYTKNEKTCKVHLNGKPVVKPYRSTIYIGNDSVKITPPSFFKLSDEDFGDLAWGWYSINEEARQMGEGVNYKGLRLRAKNMAVGNQDYLISSFKNATDANYVIGEVFIIHEGIQPTGSRDGIKSSKEYQEFLMRLKSKCKEINTVYNAMSKLGSSALNPLIKAYNGIAQNNIAVKTTSMTEEEKSQIKTSNKELKADVEKAKNEIASKIKAVDDAENTELIKELVVKHWTKVAQKTASDINAKVKVGPKIDPVNVGCIISDVVKEQKTVDTIGKTIIGKKSTNEDSNASKAVVTTPKDTDVYRGLGKSEYNLMKKVYQVLNAEKRLDDKTKESIKAKLAKKILS